MADIMHLLRCDMTDPGDKPNTRVDPLDSTDGAPLIACTMSMACTAFLFLNSIPPAPIFFPSDQQSAKLTFGIAHHAVQSILFLPPLKTPYTCFTSSNDELSQRARLPLIVD